MKWASTVAVGSPLEAIVERATDDVATALGTTTPDLLVAFVSEHFQFEYGRVPELLRKRLAPRVLLGCSAGGVIGGGTEVEREPALSLSGACLPGVRVTPLRLEPDRLPDPHHSAAAWEETVGVTAGERPHFLLLPDPYTFDAEALLRGLDAAFPQGTKIGGLASGGQRPGTNALYLDEEAHRAGLVGVTLSGDVEVDAIVAQGCRPIGEPMFVTGCDRNVICELDGSPPLDVLQELYRRSSDQDRRLFRHSLFLGIVMRERQQAYGQGDFLIRNILGVDERTGRLAVGATLRDGMVVQCHLRDARTSAEDLQQMLEGYAHRSRPTSPAGSLLFACLGRGAGLYGESNHDSDRFRRCLGDLPLGGFFCNGEIGPVQGTAFLHGYTSSFGVFRSRGS
jgi:small ligand-binding sensory domain FIST